MELLNFYLRIVPLFINVFLGFLLGKRFEVSKESVSKILIYFATPIIVFNSVYKTQISTEIFLLPFVSYIVCFVVSHIFLFIGKFLLKDNRANLLAFSVGNGNTGYFGIPLVLALFGDSFIDVYIFANLGVILYENTFGAFLIARGQYSVIESLKKLAKLPMIYALVLGLIVKYINISLGEIYDSFVLNYRGLYSTLGVMLVGIALSQIKKVEFDVKFISLNIVAKFLFWPFLMLLIIYFDKNVFHLFNHQTYQILLIQSMVPLPGNAVAFASLLNIHPEKAALTVFVSTIFALIYIPIFVALVF